MDLIHGLRLEPHQQSSHHTPIIAFYPPSEFLFRDSPSRLSPPACPAFFAGRSLRGTPEGIGEIRPAFMLSSWDSLQLFTDNQSY